MDLLGQQTQKKQKSQGQKIVLMLLIVSIVLLIIIMAMLFLLKLNKNVALTMSINNKSIQIKENMLIEGENGTNYISIESIAPLVGYEYLRGRILRIRRR